MNEMTDFRVRKLNEIMNATELLDFNYKVRSKALPLVRLAAIILVSAAMAGTLPLL